MICKSEANVKIMKSMKKIVSIFTLIALLFSLTACSSFMAIGLAENGGFKERNLTFFYLNGRKEYRFVGSAESTVNYSIKVEEGEIAVYYELDGERTELARVRDGESKEGSSGVIDATSYLLIIIEATEAKEGEVWVSLAD